MTMQGDNKYQNLTIIKSTFAHDTSSVCGCPLGRSRPSCSEGQQGDIAGAMSANSLYINSLLVYWYIVTASARMLVDQDNKIQQLNL